MSDEYQRMVEVKPSRQAVPLEILIEREHSIEKVSHPSPCGSRCQCSTDVYSATSVTNANEVMRTRSQPTSCLLDAACGRDWAYRFAGSGDDIR